MFIRSWVSSLGLHFRNSCCPTSCSKQSQLQGQISLSHSFISSVHAVQVHFLLICLKTPKIQNNCFYFIAATTADHSSHLESTASFKSDLPDTNLEDEFKRKNPTRMMKTFQFDCRFIQNSSLPYSTSTKSLVRKN